VHHSLSPAIHNAAFEALGLDWIYVPMPVPPGRAAEAVAGLRALGTAGANVTMPHKGDVARAVDERTADAELLDAVNTVVVAADALVGHNTDAPGFERYLREDLGVDPAGRRAMVYGAGGAARACVLALGRLGVEAVTVVVRSPERARPLEDVAAAAGTRLEVATFDEAAQLVADLIVNATPLGGRGEALPLPPLESASVGIDLLYRPERTPLQDAVRAAGGVAAGGIGLLLHQAALSFELWTGRPAPMAVMSAAALGALAEGGGGGRSADPGA